MEKNAMGEERLVGMLRELGDVAAPRSLAPAVLGRAGLADDYWQMETALGTVYVAHNAQGVSAVMRAPSPEAFESALRACLGRPGRRLASPPTTLARAIERRLAGDARARVPFDLRSVTPFGRAVLTKALEIPHGEVRPYAWVAREIGQPGALRAVGTALSNNPIPLLIPCHRVVRSDGTIGEYALGRQAKETMLAAEGVDLATLQRLASARVRYVGSDTTHIFCLPTCQHARRISEPHRVHFASESAAASAGYRPCRVCRPATG